MAQHMPAMILLAATALLQLPVCAELWLGSPPMGWDSFDSHPGGEYNESYARDMALIQAKTLLPSGYDVAMHEGFSAGGLLEPGESGIPYVNGSHQFRNIDEFGRPVADASRWPSSVVGSGAADCTCDPRTCTDPEDKSADCTQPVCICKEGTRSMLPFAEFLNSHGLRLGLWTWRGVHRGAVKHKLRVKGTQYTIDQIVDQNSDGTPCTEGRCPGACPWMPTLGVNASHPGAQPYYDSLYELFASWKVEYVKADCEDGNRFMETLAQSNAAKKQPLIKGAVVGSDKPRTIALSLSPGTFGAQVSSGQFIATNQAATMYRITTDFWGGSGAVFGPLSPGGGGGGSIARASLHANASLIGANGTFPDLDMLAFGQIRCRTTKSGQTCECDNCDGGGMAKPITALWAMARSPLLFGGALPADAQSLSLLTNKDMLYVHAHARNQTVFAYHQVNNSCTPKTIPACDWMAHGWTKWWADLATPAALRRGGGYGGLGWVQSSRVATGTDLTSTNPPVKAVLLINAGHAQDTYPNHGPWDGPNSTRNPWGPAGRLTLTTWSEIGLPSRPVGSGGYTARDVFSQEILLSNASGFVANVTGYNATLVLIHVV